VHSTSDTSACARELVALLAKRAKVQMYATGDVSVGKAVRSIAIASAALQNHGSGQDGSCQYVSFQPNMSYATPDKQTFEPSARFVVRVADEPLDVPGMNDPDVASLDPVAASQLVRPRMPVPVRARSSCARPPVDGATRACSRHQRSPCAFRSAVSFTMHAAA
jgi:stage V sporulation protein SpoVS